MADPRWSPAGARCGWIEETPEGPSHLHLARPDGSDRVRVEPAARRTPPTWGGTWSWCGEEAVVLVAADGRLLRVDLVDGTLDSEFYPNANAPISALLLQADGGLVIGGAFNSVWGRGSASATRTYVARFLPDLLHGAWVRTHDNGERLRARIAARRAARPDAAERIADLVEQAARR